MTARYELTQTTFIAPWKLDTGTVIEFDGEPGDHMKPLNEEAEVALEAWYSKKYTVRDDKGEEKVLTPNQLKRPLTSAQVSEARPNLLVISEPKPGQGGDDLSLAEAAITRPTQEKLTPQPVPRGPKLPLSDAPEPGDTSIDGGIKIVAPVSAPKP